MPEVNYRSLWLSIIALLLAALIGWMVTISQQWIIVVPIIAVSILILKWPFWGLSIFVMLIPLESAFLSLGDSVVSVTRLLGVFVFGVWLFGELVNRRKIKVTYELNLAFVFAVYGSASIIWAYSKSATTSRILTAFQLVMLALIIVNMVKDREKLYKLIAALFTGCLIVTLLGIFGIGVDKEGYLLTLESVGAKEYGSYVGIVFLIGSIVFIFFANKKRWFGLTAAAMATVPLIQINQRGIILAIGLVWFAIAVLTRQKAKAFFFITIMLLIFSLLPPFLEQRGVISSYNAERLTIQNMIETGGTGRSQIWGVGLKMFTNNLIIGTGWGNFPKVYNQYASSVEIFNSNYSASGKDAHSDLIGLAGELGLSGVILFLTLYGSVLLRDIRALRQIPPRNSLYLIIVIALMIYIFSAGLTSTFLWRKVYWIILGLGMISPMILSENKLQVKSRNPIFPYSSQSK